MEFLEGGELLDYVSNQEYISEGNKFQLFNFKFNKFFSYSYKVF
jgi:hypothetical protein